MQKIYIFFAADRSVFGIKKDIKLLLAHIEKKLLKKLNERPSQETLDKLALLAGFQDWESFQKEIHEKREEE